MELLSAAVAFPTVIYTALLGVVLLYWLFVILGALDIDIAGHGDVDGDVDLDLDVDAPGSDVDGGDVHVGGAGLAVILQSFGVGKVPLTVVVSTITLFSWILCVLGMRYLGGVFGDGALTTWLVKPAVFFGSLITGGLAAGVAVRPLVPTFKGHTARSRADFVGKPCIVTTGRVDANFGQAELTDGGDVLIIQVRSDRSEKGEREFSRGSRALIFDYDADREAYLILPMEDVLGEGREGK